jgi:anti-sigma factor RsiW
MNCERAEELLSRYAEGELTANERRTVDEHLAGCERCRMSLELFSSLEASLVARKAERPVARAAARNVVKRLRGEEGRTFITSPWGAPVIIGSVIALSVVCTIAFGLLVGPAPPSEPGAALTGIGGFFAGIPQFIVDTLGGETWLIVAVYVALAISFATAGGLAVLRYARG